MIREVSDRQTVSRALAHPSITPMVQGRDRSGWRYFGDERGLIAFIPRGMGTWEAHMFMPNGGAAVALREACEAMLESGAHEIIGAINESNTRALRAALRAGCRYVALLDGWHQLRYENGRNR